MNFATNKKALHDYIVESKLEVGIVLVGTEVKVLRGGGINLAGAWIKADDKGLWLMQANLPGYEFGNRFNHNELRMRRLLAHKREIRKLRAATEQKGMSLIPLRIYSGERGLMKLELGVCKGKHNIDKRETIKRREADIEARRQIKRWR